MLRATRARTLVICEREIREREWKGARMRGFQGKLKGKWKSAFGVWLSASPSRLYESKELFSLRILFKSIRAGDKVNYDFLIMKLLSYSAGNNFSLFRGHMSCQIFILVGHLTNWTGHHLLTDNTLKKITQDVLVRCSVIVSDHNLKLAGHFQNLVGQCPMTDCYFQHWS